MTTFIDAFGCTVTQSEDGAWIRGGCAVGPCDADAALSVFDGMAPDGWSSPVQSVSVPASITNFQCRAILLATPDPADATKTLFDLVEGQLTAMAKTSSAYQAWEYANDVTRDGALVMQMAASLGLTSAQVDEMFITASGISA